jgi:outer membrane protein W
MTALLVAIAVVTVPASAQSLAKRHQIELRAGGWSQVTDNKTEIGDGGVTATGATTGFVGGLAYGHWVEEQLALRICASLLETSVDVQATASGVTTESAAVIQVMLGTRYYFPKSTYGEQFRPFGGLGVGPVFGTQENVRVGTTVVTEARNEMAVAGELEAGIGILLDKRVLATVAIAYDLMTDFAEPIAGSRNHSGPQMTLGLSLLLGTGPGGS